MHNDQVVFMVYFCKDKMILIIMLITLACVDLVHINMQLDVAVELLVMTILEEF